MQGQAMKIRGSHPKRNLHIFTLGLKSDKKKKQDWDDFQSLKATKYFTSTVANTTYVWDCH